MDAKGYMMDVKGYSVDAKGYMMDVKSIFLKKVKMTKNETRFTVRSS